jgi:hypothetical protein
VGWKATGKALIGALKTGIPIITSFTAFFLEHGNYLPSIDGMEGPLTSFFGSLNILAKLC